jgi:hypothetical protein
MRKAGMGKRKGSAFERKVCEQLSLWITNDKDKDTLWRSSMSGGRATVHLKKGKTNQQAGDICAVAVEGHRLTSIFYVECKHYKDLAIGSFFTIGTGKLRQFWDKTIAEAAKHNRRPMLIAKQNNVPAMVLIRAGELFAEGRYALLKTGDIVTEVWILDELVKSPFTVAPPKVYGNIITSAEGINVLKKNAENV